MERIDYLVMKENLDELTNKLATDKMDYSM